MLHHSPLPHSSRERDQTVKAKFDLPFHSPISLDHPCPAMSAADDDDEHKPLPKEMLSQGVYVRSFLESFDPVQCETCGNDFRPFRQRPNAQCLRCRRFVCPDCCPYGTNYVTLCDSCIGKVSHCGCCALPSLFCFRRYSLGDIHLPQQLVDSVIDQMARQDTFAPGDVVFRKAGARSYKNPALARALWTLYERDEMHLHFVDIAFAGQPTSSFYALQDVKGMEFIVSSEWW